jgi:NAD(P)-dependent dehydrogenase (short-subunit alcohol dehydrogenase family)
MPRASGRLSDKVALVVGAGQIDQDFEFPGTGAAAAVLMAAEGASVAVMARTALTAGRTVDHIRSRDGCAIAVLGDATREDDCRSAVDAVIEQFGHVDILVNNLGLAIGGSVVELSESDWDQAMRVNLKPVLFASKFAIPHMEAAGQGAIVNIGSGSGMQADGNPAYGTAKAGLVGLTRDMAVTHGASGIRVNCVVPGPLRTPMVAAYHGRGLFREVCMLHIDGTGWDVGWAVVFLVSDEARFITAATLAVDGGAMAQSPMSVALRLRGSELMRRDNTQRPAGA